MTSPSICDRVDAETLDYVMHTNNVTRKDLERPVEAMFSAGLNKMASVIGAMKFLRQQADLAEDRRKLAAGVPEEQVERERELANKPMRDAAALPLWQRLTGLTKDRVNDMGPDERRRALNRLYNAARLLFRHEIAANSSPQSAQSPQRSFESLEEQSSRNISAGSVSSVVNPETDVANGSPQSAQSSQRHFESEIGKEKISAGSAGSVVNPETDVAEIDLDAPAPRTHLWDPIREACHFLQISKAALSRYLIEASGMSAIELVDAIKAKSVKAKMRTVLFPTLKKLIVDTPSSPSPLVGEGPGMRAAAGQTPKERARMALWKRLKDSRRNPDFQRAIYAIDLGFSSHQRMYRACVLAHRKTPSQLEWELIDEFLAECETNSSPQSSQSPQSGGDGTFGVDESTPIRAITDDPPDTVDDGGMTHQIA